MGTLREMGLAYHDPEAHLTTGSKSTHSSQLARALASWLWLGWLAG